MKKIITSCIALLATISLAVADEPRGYSPTEDFEEVQKEAIEKKKFITVLFKGNNDSCPNCTTTIKNGERAVKSSSKLIFCRVKTYWDKKTGLPEKMLSQVDQLSGGASVYFYVFEPTTLDLVAKGGRKELQSDKKAIRAFKNTVRTAKKKL